jgi:hypothetical protein
MGGTRTSHPQVVKRNGLVEPVRNLRFPIVGDGGGYRSHADAGVGDQAGDEEARADLARRCSGAIWLNVSKLPR